MHIVLNYRSLKYQKSTKQSMLIRFLSRLMKINIEFMGDVWRWALQADKAGPDFNPQKPPTTYPVGSSHVDSCLGVPSLASRALWDWFPVLGPSDVQRRPAIPPESEAHHTLFPSQGLCSGL